MKKYFMLLLLLSSLVSCSHTAPSRKIAQEYGNETGNRHFDENTPPQKSTMNKEIKAKRLPQGFDKNCEVDECIAYLKKALKYIEKQPAKSLEDDKARFVSCATLDIALGEIIENKPYTEYEALKELKEFKEKDMFIACVTYDQMYRASGGSFEKPW